MTATTTSPMEEKANESDKGVEVDSAAQKDSTITEETLKPITKVNSKLDKELQELEVESTKGGRDLSQ